MVLYRITENKNMPIHTTRHSLVVFSYAAEYTTTKNNFQRSDVVESMVPRGIVVAS